VADSYSYLRHADLAELRAGEGNARVVRKLLDKNSGAQACGVSILRTPPGEGSSRGLHTHTFEQIYFLLEGVMNIEVDGEVFQASAGDLVVFPAGTPHRNWTAGDESTMHLAISAPAG
jgi:quercetin dioxygenase-like cupin family protein